MKKKFNLTTIVGYCDLMKRKAAVAGGFYPRFKNELIEIIEDCFTDSNFGPGKLLTIGKQQDSQQVFGGICPHAGYTYSGPAAAHTIQHILSDGCPDAFIVLGTQHTGYHNVSLMKSGSWTTPIGDLDVDSELATAILNECDDIINDDSAFFGFPHGREHNIEVQLPFLKYAADKANKKVRFVPIKVGTAKFKKLQDVGHAIARAIKSLHDKKRVVIIASSDMTHKSPSNPRKPDKDLEDMKSSDNAVIEAIKNFDWKTALEKALNTTVCGPQTITVAMIACQELGSKNAEILKYYNSYEKMGSPGVCEYAVGYLSAVFRR